MQEMIFNFFKDLLSNSLATDIANFMGKVLDSLKDILNANISSWLAIFSVIAASLLIIYFFMNVASDVSREMLSLDKLILYFIRMFLAFMILIYLKDILIQLTNLCYNIYKYVGSKLSATGNMGVTFFGKPVSNIGSVTYQAHKAEMDTAFDFALSKIAGYLHIMLLSFICWLISFVLRIVAYFICISNALALIARIIFAPLAVVQCFDPLQHNKGIDYIKKMVSTLLSFAIIVGILYAASLFQGNLFASLVGTQDVNAQTMHDMISKGGSTFAIILVCQFAGIGGLLGANKIANDVVGTH